MNEEIVVKPDSTARIGRGWKPTARRTMVVRVIQVALVVGFLLLWEYGSGNPKEETTLIDEFYVGKPSEAFLAAKSWVADGSLWPHLVATIRASLSGFAIGCAGGMLVGFALGVNDFINRVFNPFITAAFSVPTLALAPLFILWFGIGISSKVALVAFLIFFLVFFNAYAGVRDVDRDLIDVLRTMGANWFQVHVKVTMPSATTWVLTGLRVSVPIAFVGTVVSEMIAASRGMGTLIARAASSFNPSSMFAAIGILVIMSVTLNALVTIVERFSSKWKIPSRDTAAQAIR